MTDAPQQASSEESEESSAAALARLFRDHNRVLVAYLSVRLHSEQEAKEVAQEAYARLLQTARIAHAGLWRGLLFKTATNLAIDRLRHRGVEQRAEQRIAVHEQQGLAGARPQDPAEEYLEHEQAGQLAGYVAELPLETRQALYLCRIRGLAQDEVARQLQISARMVRRHVSYAMLYCRLRLEGVTMDQARTRITL